jgi:hypothetical protein
MRMNNFTIRFLAICGAVIGGAEEISARSGGGSLRAARQLDHTTYDGVYWPRYDEYACRTGSGGRGSDGDEFVEYEYKSLSWCKEKCYKTSDCEAFEYEVDGSYYKCEIWYEKPKQFSRNDGHSCWIKNEEGVMENDGGDSDGTGDNRDVYNTIEYIQKEDSACRTADGRNGSHGAEYYRYSEKSLEWCTDKCNQLTDCTGFEYKEFGTTHCEIWTAYPAKYTSKGGLSCYVKITP